MANEFEKNTKVRMTAAELMRSEGAILNIVRNPKTGNLFFACGTKKGFISKNVRDNLSKINLDQLGYAEVKATIDGKDVIVPTLFLATANVVKSFKL